MDGWDVLFGVLMDGFWGGFGLGVGGGAGRLVNGRKAAVEVVKVWWLADVEH